MSEFSAWVALWPGRWMAMTPPVRLWPPSIEASTDSHPFLLSRLTLKAAERFKRTLRRFQRPPAFGGVCYRLRGGRFIEALSMDAQRESGKAVWRARIGPGWAG